MGPGFLDISGNPKRDPLGANHENHLIGFCIDAENDCH